MNFKNLLLYLDEPHIFFVILLFIVGVTFLLMGDYLNAPNYGVIIYIGKYKYVVGSVFIITAIYGFYVIYKSKDQRKYICMECAEIEYGKKGSKPLCKKCGKEMKLSWRL